MIAAVSESWQCSTTSRRNEEKENLTIESRKYLLQRNEDDRIELRVPGNGVPARGEIASIFLSLFGADGTRQDAEARHFRIALPSDTISIPTGMVWYYRNATGRRETK
jgi:hypothetical protein